MCIARLSKQAELLYHRKQILPYKTSQNKKLSRQCILQNSLGECLLVRVEEEKEKVNSAYKGKKENLAFEDISINSITFAEV